VSNNGSRGDGEEVTGERTVGSRESGVDSRKTVQSPREDTKSGDE